MGPMECPHCGALVPSRRICCASCGSDLETGWKDAQEIDYSSVDLPDEELASEADPEIHQAKIRSVGILLAFFIAAPLSLFLFDNTMQVLVVWLVLGLLLGIHKTRS